MKKLNFLLLIGVVAFFGSDAAFSNAQTGKGSAKTTSSKLKATPKAPARAARPQNQSAATGKQHGLVGLTSNSFTAKGLHNEKILRNIYLGEFAEIPFDREDLNFSMLYGAYLNSYARRCGAHLPRNKVEMTYQECDVWRVTRNGYGVETSRYCARWETVGTGLYADPQMYEAKSALDRIQAGDALRTVFGMLAKPDPLAGAMNMAGNAQAAGNDMEALVQMNACVSSGLKRFQENLRLFALNKQPLRLEGAQAGSSSSAVAVKRQPGAAFKDQNYAGLLEDLIFEQSKTWTMNQFARGSVSGVAVSERDERGRPAKITARYIYHGFRNNSPGAVILTFADGWPECLYFFDFPAACRTPNRRIAAAYADGAYQK